MERRVVITGLGAITPIGNTVSKYWEGLKTSKCGIDKITLFDTSEYKVKIAAEVKEYNPEDFFDKREARRLDRFSQFAIIAAREAKKDSGLDNEKIDNKLVKDKTTCKCHFMHCCTKSFSSLFLFFFSFCVL